MSNALNHIRSIKELITVVLLIGAGAFDELEADELDAEEF